MNTINRDRRASERVAVDPESTRVTVTVIVCVEGALAEPGREIISISQVGLAHTQADLEAISWPVILDAGRQVHNGIVVHPRRPTREEIHMITSQRFIHRVELGQVPGVSMTSGDNHGEHADPMLSCPACRRFWGWVGGSEVNGSDGPLDEPSQPG